MPRVTQLAGVMCDAGVTHRWKPGAGGGGRLGAEPGWGRSRAPRLGPACVPMCKNRLNGNFEYRLLQNRTCFSLFSFHLSAINTYYLWKNVLNKVISNINTVVRRHKEVNICKFPLVSRYAI